MAFAFFLTHNARGGVPAIADVRAFHGDPKALRASELPPDAAAKEEAEFGDRDAELKKGALPRTQSPVQLEASLSRMEASVRRALCEQPSIELLLEQLLRGASFASLNELCICRPGLPLLPMLAKPSRGFDDVFERLGEATFTCEYKYDGERIQIHVMRRSQLNALQDMLKQPPSESGSQKTPARAGLSSLQKTLPFGKAAEKKSQTAQSLQSSAVESQRSASAKARVGGEDESGLVVRLYSRSLEDITERFPDVCALVLSEIQPEVTDCILDAEVVAFDLATRSLLPFQTLSTRKRKQVSLDEIQVNVALYCFDCMRFNGVSALSQPLGKRRDLLRKAVSLNPEGRVLEARHKELKDREEFEDFLCEAVASESIGLLNPFLEGRLRAKRLQTRRKLRFLRRRLRGIDGEVSRALRKLRAFQALELLAESQKGLLARPDGLCRLSADRRLLRKSGFGLCHAPFAEPGLLFQRGISNGVFKLPFRENAVECTGHTCSPSIVQKASASKPSARPAPDSRTRCCRDTSNL